MTMPDTTFDQLLTSGQPIILDGGLATELEAQGYNLNSALWSAELLRNHPQAITDAHRAYYEAGANCAISASYQATLKGFMGLGLDAEQAQDLILSSVRLAIDARDAYFAQHPDSTHPLLVAASVGPYGAPLGDGSEYTGDYGVNDAALVAFHQQRLQWLDHSGADVLACETIPSLQEAKVLHELLAQCQTPAWISFSCKDGQHLNDGSPIADCARLFAQHPTVRAIGVNCTSPLYINELISCIKQVIEQTGSQLAIVVYPNSGEHYQASDNSWHGTSTPMECGLAAASWQHSGAAIIGGCCRMGPEHIRQIQQHLHSLSHSSSHPTSNP